ncbi:MAG: ion channel [Bacillota bacterium]|nr:ion channel [Bacillota bacterium]
MFYFLMSIITFCIFMSLRTLFLQNFLKGKLISIENFLYLGIIYVTILLGFGLIYLIFSFRGTPILLEIGNGKNENIFETCFYFSAMTLFSVGNGDVVPQGLGRMIAVIEALIGYTLPAAIVARAMFDREQ